MFENKELEETTSLHFNTKDFTINDITSMLEVNGWAAEN